MSRYTESVRDLIDETIADEETAKRTLVDAVSGKTFTRSDGSTFSYRPDDAIERWSAPYAEARGAAAEAIVLRRGVEMHGEEEALRLFLDDRLRDHRWIEGTTTRYSDPVQEEMHRAEQRGAREFVASAVYTLSSIESKRRARVEKEAAATAALLERHPGLVESPHAKVVALVLTAPAIRAALDETALDQAHDSVGISLVGLRDEIEAEERAAAEAARARVEEARRKKEEAIARACDHDASRGSFSRCKNPGRYRVTIRDDVDPGRIPWGLREAGATPGSTVKLCGTHLRSDAKTYRARAFYPGIATVVDTKTGETIYEDVTDEVVA
jgi:hypothetical protein